MSTENFSFNVLKENNSARLGTINTHRGKIDTPTFMPVGTQGTVKSVFIDDGDKAPLKQVVDGMFGVKVTATMRNIGRGQQNLRYLDLVLGKASFIMGHQMNLTNRCRRLLRRDTVGDGFHRKCI